MAKRLSGMKISEISLVDHPANKDARVEIVKRAGQPTTEGPMDPEELEDAINSIEDEDTRNLIAGAFETLAEELEESEGAIEKASEAMEIADEAITKSEARVAELEGEITKRDERIAKMANGEAVDDDEAIFKGMTPEAKTRFIALEAVNKKAEEETAIEKARKLGVGDPAKLGPALARIAKGKGTADDAALIESTLTMAGTAIKKGGLFTTVGSTGGDSATALAKLNARAEDIRKSDAKMTAADAFTKACEQDPAAYEQYLAERKAA